MEKIIRVEKNCETGEQVEIELTEQEVAQILEDRITAQRLEAERVEAEQKKLETKTSALAKLAALGLTEDEAKAIAG